ncbi:hypothetical protein BV22DRAFT_642767 [Leucogyrophana mollusca]|uniref:Uncharacterized protein n=1 Tax=Leucogyrophana mollusca TaxID=85980 RepID=A0ACB8BBJ1_9AGAM|nr:hypothetical protein BV22DRAFT_642767 [Leucogyrophana mollusca]
MCVSRRRQRSEVSCILIISPLDIEHFAVLKRLWCHPRQPMAHFFKVIDVALIVLSLLIEQSSSLVSKWVIHWHSDSKERIEKRVYQQPMADGRL